MLPIDGKDVNVIRVGLIGATGYTGTELLRLLSAHPEVRIVAATSRSECGRAVADVFPNLRGHVNLVYEDPARIDYSNCELVYFAAPNGTAMQVVPSLLQRGIRVIDLAADFRLRNPAQWQQWYGMPHLCPEYLEEAVYGLPELNRAAISKARLVANPGCYPTSVILGLLPLLQADLIEPGQIIADAKSGVSGAGRKAELGLLLAETAENFKAYNASRHRHQPEIAQALAAVAGVEVGLTFVPHLVPMIRGIHSTLYGRLKPEVDLSDAELHRVFLERYENEPFVEIGAAGSHPDTRSVRGANLCKLSVHRPPQGRMVVVLSVIDNLVKGAAGQAVQNMNLMFGLEETLGLQAAAVFP